MASPVSSATKDMVLSPLSKLAKGVQSLGANLDPRKMKVNSDNTDKTELSTSFYLALLYPRLRLGSHYIRKLNEFPEIILSNKQF